MEVIVGRFSFTVARLLNWIFCLRSNATRVSILLQNQRPAVSPSSSEKIFSGSQDLVTSGIPNR